MDIFGQVQIGILTKYDMNKKAICKIQLSDREKDYIDENALLETWDEILLDAKNNNALVY